MSKEKTAIIEALAEARGEYSGILEALDNVLNEVTAPEFCLMLGKLTEDLGENPQFIEFANEDGMKIEGTIGDEIEVTAYLDYDVTVKWVALREILKRAEKAANEWEPEHESETTTE